MTYTALPGIQRKIEVPMPSLQVPCYRVSSKDRQNVDTFFLPQIITIPRESPHLKTVHVVDGRRQTPHLHVMFFEVTGVNLENSKGGTPPPTMYVHLLLT